MSAYFKDDRLNALFGRALTALQDYRDDVVLIGGLVPFLYQRVDGFDDPGFTPFGTMDLDLAVANHIPTGDRQTIRTLLEGAGFHEATAPSFDLHEDLQYFQLSSGPSIAEDHLEFLTPLHGPEEQGLSRPQKGLVAQRLRFIDLLRACPIACDMGEYGHVLVPHPATYVIQKTRIRDYRARANKAQKDQADIFYVVWSFQSQWTAWSNTLRELSMANPTWSKWIATALTWLRRLYDEPTGPGPSEVSRLFAQQNSTLDTAVVRQVMADFLATLETA